MADYQETANFNNYKTRFYQYSLSDLIDGPPQVPDPYRSIFTDAHRKLNEYFADDKYRGSLSEVKKNSIEGQIANILSQFDQLISIRNSNLTQTLPQITSFASNIQSYLEDFDMRFSIPYQLYLLQNQGNIGSIIDEIKRKNVEASSIKDELALTLTEAKLLTGTASSDSFASYYQKLANGLYTKENDERKSKAPNVNYYKTAIPIALVGLFVIFGANELIDSYLFFIRNGILGFFYLFGGLVFILSWLIPILINNFNKSYPGGYQRSAALWFVFTIISVIVTAIYASILVIQLGENPGWEELIPKLISLLAPAYLIRFSVQNYKANKHLQVTYTHKATVSKVATTFSDQIKSTNEASKKDELIARANIIDKAASVAFDPGESGFITTKEGAGSGGNDGFFDGIMDRLNKS